MDNVQNYDSYINIPSSRAYISVTMFCFGLRKLIFFSTLLDNKTVQVLSKNVVTVLRECSTHSLLAVLMPLVGGYASNSCCPFHE
jgi:hypothetical protein